MGDARVLLDEELQELVRDAAADVSSAAGELGLRAPRRSLAPRRERRRPPQATIVPLTSASPPALAVGLAVRPPRPLPQSAAEAPGESAGIPSVDAAAGRGQRAFLLRLDVPSQVPVVQHPARTRRLAVPCRRASPLDVRRTSRLLRVSVPAAALGPALPLTVPPAWPRPDQLAAAPAPIPAVIDPPSWGRVEVVGRSVDTERAPVPPSPTAASAAVWGGAAPPAPPPPVAPPAPPLPAATGPASDRSAEPEAVPAGGEEEEALPVWKAAAGYAGNLAIAAALGLVTIFCGIVVGLVVTGHHLEQVITGSMQPTIPIGSLVVTERVPVNQLRVGDIIVFPNPDNSKETIVHRIVWMGHDQQGDVLVRTKGDYNALPDGWTLSRPADADADRVTLIIPGAGTVAGGLQAVGLWGLVALIAGGVGWYGVRRVRSILAEAEDPPPPAGETA
jgi:signal peptidase I